MDIFSVDILIDKKKVLYRLTKPLEIGGFVIPEGFITDGASVPKMFWGFFPPVLDYFGASTLHDYLLYICTDWKEAERHFKRALLNAGVGGVRTWIMLNAVRVNGFLKGRRF